jgi:inosose dehydratase
MLDELIETGYTGTELGDWGYMPTDPEALNAELAKRNHLVMLGAFVPVALKNPATHADGVAKAVKTARLIAAVATTQAPYLVLADDNGTDPTRTHLAGRIPASAGLSKDEWRTFAGGADRIAHAVFDETGLSALAWSSMPVTTTTAPEARIATWSRLLIALRIASGTFT